MGPFRLERGDTEWEGKDIPYVKGLHNFGLKVSLN